MSSEKQEELNQKETGQEETKQEDPKQEAPNPEESGQETSEQDPFPKRFKDGLKTAIKKLGGFFAGEKTIYTVLTVILLPVILVLIVEALSRNSFLDSFLFLVQHPVPFFVNACIVACTIVPALIFRRRLFVYVIASAFWIVLGAVNRSLLLTRVTPFNATDIFMVKTGMRIANKYIAPGTYVLWIAVGVVGLAFLVFLWIKGPKVKGKMHRIRNAAISVAVIAGTFLALSLSITFGQIASTFNNLPNAYKAYGFNYCFLNSVFDNGVRKPSGYSSDSIVEIVDELEIKENDITQVTDKTPNIIIIQLESFFDITRMGNLTFSEDPIPNFRSLSKEFNGGLLSVPSIGAGTSNTEFEVLTGMNLEDFGAGEIPYKGVLLKETCESIAYDLSANGYMAHAIHNNDATFYQRHTVYPNLGFDTFTSMEYMFLTRNDFTPKNWVRDEVLTKHIEDCLDYTPEGVDFVFTVSVEGHGSYPNVDTPGMNEIRVTSTEGSTQYAVQFYTNLLHDMDLFVKDLVDMLSARGEETILFLYGDHLPSLGLEQSNMAVGDLMQTDYAIWNNMGLDLDFQDLETYQVMPKLLGAIGIKTGVINSYHQTHINDEEGEYLSGLQNLEYDMLYGAKAALGSRGAYETKDMKFGIRDAAISEVSVRSLGEDTYVYVNGMNFTNWSMININGTYYRTEILTPSTIRVKYDSLLPQDEIFVAQVGDDKYQLSQTDVYIYE